jgi:hypothetical protein
MGSDRKWDPIGVEGVAEAASEYDRYVGAVGRMLRERATPGEIAYYLTDMREHYIGLGPSPGGQARDDAVAAHLVEWYDHEMRAADATVDTP